VNDRSAMTPITASIAAVERDTGLSKDTLRVWERRYGFPAPERDQFGERAYPLDQIEKLRVIKRLLDAGHRPGRVVALDIAQLQKIGDALPSALQRSASNEGDLRVYVDLLKSHDVQAVRRALAQAQLRLGLSALVTDLIAPLNTLVGDAWMRGQLEVFEEHVYTESLSVLLRSALASIPPHDEADRPRVLLSTFPHEPHGLGLLMAQTLLALEGCYCVSLGPQTPIADIALAASAYQIDVVALSFTATLNPNYVLSGLAELRTLMGPRPEIWVGGQCPAIHRKPIETVHTIASLPDVATEVARWRAGAARKNR
jgi:MerR family transcriptional regulator, light-induced transcriptional regulator